MLKSLDHVNVRTPRLAVLKDFYVAVLGLTDGARPDFPFTGAWLYCGKQPVIHLVEVGPEQPWAPAGSDAALQHFAFAAEGMPEFLACLNERSVSFRIRSLPEWGLCQVHLQDPDGNHLHVDFPIAEAQGQQLSGDPS